MSVTAKRMQDLAKKSAKARAERKAKLAEKLNPPADPPPPPPPEPKKEGSPVPTPAPIASPGANAAPVPSPSVEKRRKKPAARKTRSAGEPDAAPPKKGGLGTLLAWIAGAVAGAALLAGLALYVSPTTTERTEIP